MCVCTDKRDHWTAETSPRTSLKHSDSLPSSHIPRCPIVAVLSYTQRVPWEKKPFQSKAELLINYLPGKIIFSQKIMFSSVHSVVFNSLQPHGLQHARLPCPSPTPRACSNSCPSTQGCHSTISSSVIPFSSYLQSFPASRTFPMSQFFASGGQSTGASALASVLPMNVQDWSPLGLTGLISLQSKGLSIVFSNTTVQKHQFICAQLSLWSKSHIHTWHLERYP